MASSAPSSRPEGGAVARGAEDAMPYAEGRTYHDADSHVMETPDWLVAHADPGVRARLKPLFVAAVKPGEETMIEQARRRHLDPAERERAAAELMLRKNWNAMGSFVREDRPRALDLLGFSSQLVFNTFLNPYLLDAERKDGPDFANGLPPVPDFHGGAENFRSVDYMAIPFPPMQTLSTLIIDGILDRFPRLKIGVIEQGAVWVPSWMRQLDTTVAAFSKNEERLKRLQLRPSEYVRRQIRVTPYPHEPVGWIIEQAGEEVCLFSSDWPHVEGGRNPLRRFEESTKGLGERAKERFYCDNFVDLMGAGLNGL